MVSADAAGGGHGNAGAVLFGGLPLLGGAFPQPDNNKIDIVKASTENHTVRLAACTNGRRGLLSDLHRFHAQWKTQAETIGCAMTKARAGLIWGRSFPSIRDIS